MYYSLWTLSTAVVILIIGFIVVLVPTWQGKVTPPDHSSPYFTESALPLVQATQLGLTFAPFGDQSSGGQGEPIDGISVNQMEQDGYHTHVHLSLYVHGKQAAIPSGIGIVPPWQGSPDQFIEGGSALYWLHTHDNSGIIHIETPGRKNFTLGNFFDIWGVFLSQNRFLNVNIRVSAYVDGVPFTGNPRDIELTPHRQITLELGSPIVLPRRYTFPKDLLKTETVQ